MIENKTQKILENIIYLDNTVTKEVILSVFLTIGLLDRNIFISPKEA
jgi:hypothetical protein